MSLAQPTLEDVWQLFRETDRLLKEQLKAQSTEADRRFIEADRRFQETERLLKDQSKETQRLLREQAQAAEKRSQEIDRKIGKLSNRLVEFVENAVRPAAVRLFQECKIAVHEVYHGVSVQRGNEGLEIDLLVVNDQDAVLIECKSNLNADDIKDHLERLSKVKRLMPKYANSRILGAVASMAINNEIVKYAYLQGLFVIGQSGDDLLIYNDDYFIPIVW